MLEKRYGGITSLNDYLGKLKRYLNEPGLCVWEMGTGRVFDEHDKYIIAQVDDKKIVRDMNDYIICHYSEIN